MTYFNNLGQGRVGWRSPGGGVTPSSLWTSVYGVWNADASNTVSVKNAWNANGDAVDSKSGANGTIATPSGTSWAPTTMTYGSGKIGSGAFTFNGSNFVSLPDNTLNFTGDFSVSCWVYLTSTAGTNILLSFDNSSTPAEYNGWQIQCASDKAWLYIYNSGGSSRYYGIGVPIPGINQWIHLTVTKTVGQEGNIYVNGVLGTKTTVSGGGGTSTMNPTYRSRAYIGAGYFLYANPAYTPSPSGLKIDAIQTWDGTALDQTAVTELYNSGNGQEYPFTTSNALIPSPNDAVGTNHGTLMNGCTFATGKIGQAFTFDGINDYVALPNNIMKFSNTDNWSISFWIYVTVTGVSGVIGNWDYNGSQGTGWGIGTNGTVGGDPSKFTIYFFTNWVTGLGNLLNPLSTDGTTSINTWNHFVITRNSSAQEKIYQNGTLVASQTNSSTKLTYPATSYSCIGANRYQSTVTNYAKAGTKIDAMSVWNKELTAADITDLYNAGAGKQYPTT